MSAISPELERVMRDVGAPSSQPYQNVRAVIESSPVLMQQPKPFNWKHRLSCLLAGCLSTACSFAGPAAPPSPTDSSFIQTKGDNMSMPSSVPGAPRDAAELLHRMLALIDAIHRPEDLTQERVTQFIGLPMKHDNDPRDDYYYAYHELTNMWQVRLFRGLEYDTKRPYVGFSFLETEKYRDQRRPPMTEICQFDMAQFHEALLGLGYKQVGNTRGATLERQYRRYPVYLNVGYVGESSESLEKISHDCVDGIYVTFDTMPEESKQ